MNRLYFVRHGEGQDNVARQFSYLKTDRPLTERGRLQAQQTAGFLISKRIDSIYSSPMKRALETAQIIAERLDKEVIVLEEFREVNVGELEGQYFSNETWGQYLRVTGAWFDGNSHAALPGGENYVTLWNRMHSGLVQMLAGKSDQNILLVGHAGIFIASLKNLCPDISVDWLKNAECYNCSITELELETLGGNLRGRLVAWAGHDHLRGDALHLVPGIPPLDSLS